MLVSQFPLDCKLLDETLPALWARWDIDGSGFVEKREFVEKGGLLDFVREYLLHQQLSTRRSVASEHSSGAVQA